jgi:hypothetical protein
MARSNEVDKAAQRVAFLEMSKSEVLTPDRTSILKQPTLLPAGVSELSVEAESDMYQIYQKIPLQISINNKFCKQGV